MLGWMKVGFAGSRSTAAVVASLVLVGLARIASAQSVYEEKTYDAQGELILYRGPVYGPNPDPNELAALTWNWTYSYPPGYVLTLSETGPQGHSIAWTWDSACNNTQIDYQNGALLDNRQWDSLGRLTQHTRTSGGSTATWTYTYPGTRRQRVTDPRGKVSEFQLDTFGRKILDAGPADSGTDLDNLIAVGTVRTFAYDSAGNLTATTNELGATWSFTYDSMGHRLTATDPAGLQFSYAYDSAGRLVSETRPGSPNGLPSIYYSYDAAGNVDVVGKRVDAQVVRYEARSYDAAGNITAVAGPGSSPTDALNQLAQSVNVRFQWTYDALGRCITETRSDGEVITYAYDARNNQLLRSSNRGPMEMATYDWLDHRTGVRSNKGGTTTMTYDSLGRVIAETGPWDDADGNWSANDVDPAAVRVTTYNLFDLPTWTRVDTRTPQTTVYDQWLPIAVTEGTATTTCQYDAAGRPIVMTSASGCATQRTYDAAGRCVSELRAPGTSSAVRVDRAYDADDRLISTAIYPTSGSSTPGHVATQTFDSAGRLAGGVDFDGRAWSRTFDAAGRVISVGPVGGLQTTFTWDTDGLLIARSTRGGPTTTYTYDAAWRVVAVTEGGVRNWLTSYDSVGRVSSVTYPDNSVVSYQYDSAGRTAIENFGGGYARTRTYDGRSRTAQVADNSSSYTYTFDRYDQMTSRTDQAGRTLSVAYGPDGESLSMTYPGGDVFGFSYDTFGRLTSVSRTAGGITGPAASLQYDGLDRVNVLTHANGCVESVNYDGADRIAKLSLADPQANVLEIQAATRDGCGRLLSVSHANGDLESFAYDASGQITQASRTGANPFAAAYAYDTAGNLISETFNGTTTVYSHNALGELTARAVGGSVTAYTYDPRGSEVQRVSTAGTVSTTYNVRGLPQTVTDSAAGKTWAYEYDPWGKRVGMTDGSTSEAYVYDGMFNRIETYVNGGLSEVAFALDAQKTLETWTSVANQGYFFSLSGNVDRVLAGNGTVAGQYVYDPFGSIVAATGAGSRTKYQGLPHDGALDVYDNVARIWAPSGRGFQAADPLRTGPAYGTYQRAFNDPVNYADVTGLCEHGALKMNITYTTSTSELGKTDVDNAEFECHTEEITYLLGYNYEGSCTWPCWYRRQPDCDKASVMKTSDCTCSLTVITGAPGSTIKADLDQDMSGSKEPYFVDMAGWHTIVWHEDAHVAIIKAFLEGLWEKGKKSLGGATNQNPDHDEERSKNDAQSDWDKKWNALKEAMKKALKKSSAKGGDLWKVHQHFEAYMKAAHKASEHRGKDESGGELIDDQSYGGDDPKSHENNAHAKQLQKDAKEKGEQACPKSFQNFPCKCKHK